MELLFGHGDFMNKYRSILKLDWLYFCNNFEYALQFDVTGLYDFLDKF